MSTRQARRRRAARCHQCRFAIRWLRHRGGWRAFDPTPVDGRRYPGVGAFPVENSTKHARRFAELVEDLMVRRHCSREEAEDEVYAMPFYVLHACPPQPQKKETQR